MVSGAVAAERFPDAAGRAWRACGRAVVEQHFKRAWLRAHGLRGSTDRAAVAGAPDPRTQAATRGRRRTGRKRVLPHTRTDARPTHARLWQRRLGPKLRVTDRDVYKLARSRRHADMQQAKAKPPRQRRGDANHGRGGRALSFGTRIIDFSYHGDAPRFCIHAGVSTWPVSSVCARTGCAGQCLSSGMNAIEVECYVG